MRATLELLDMVALVTDLPEAGLRRGQVGTVVDVLEKGRAYEIDFSDDSGRTYAIAALTGEQLLRLSFERDVSAAA